MKYSTKQCKIGLAIVDNKTIKLFNKKYLAHDSQTDVISFEMNADLPEGFHFLGDIIVSLDQVKKQSKEYKVSESEELARVIAHGVLHLLGFTDETASEKKKMKEKEDTVVKRIFKQ